MNRLRQGTISSILALVMAAFALPTHAQVPVDASGEPIGAYSPSDEAAATGNEGIPLLDGAELEDLVGPIALYPDDLLAVVLPATTYPLQLVQAQRFLDELENDPSLKPDEEWDDSVVALLNYPEVLELLNEDLDWTWRLGEAVVAQHSDVVAAVEGFRDRAYAAGNLESDEHQTVSFDDGTIEITPVDDDIIYVPYYEPERVVVYQPEPVYHYYPTPYPVYYYPYPASHAFNRGFFWGVTTAYSLGWLTDRVHVIHHTYYGHPYYGRSYWNGWWYRRPTINIHTRYYSGSNYSVSRYRYSRGDYWRPRYDSRRRLSNHRIVRSDYYSPSRNAHTRTSSYRGNTVRTRSERSRVTHPRRSQPVVQSERPRRTQPSVRQDRAQRSQPAIREERARRSQPAVQTDRQRRVQPVVREDRSRRSQPAFRDERPRRSQPAIQNDRSQRAQPVVREDRARRAQPRSTERPATPRQNRSVEQSNRQRRESIARDRQGHDSNSRHARNRKRD